MTTTKTARPQANPGPDTAPPITTLPIGHPFRRPVLGVYLRISQAKDGTTIDVDRQLPPCQRIVEREGGVTPEWAIYKDNDKSATSGKPRPEYERMLADVRAGRLDGIVAWHPDRIYRVMRDLLELIDVVEKAAIPIYTDQAGDLDLSSPFGQMVAKIVGALAEHELKLKTARWLLSVKDKRKRGEVPNMGTRIFGYTEDGEIVPDEAFVLRQAIRRYIGGQDNITAMCHRLNEAGFTTVAGNPWSTSSMRKLLDNPRIAGYSTLRGEVYRDPNTGEPCRGSWEPIIDDQTWQVLAALRGRITRPSYPRVALVGGGLVVCDRCDTPLVTSGSHGFRIYRCPPPSTPGKRKGCGRVSGKAEAIEYTVEQAAKAKLADKRVRKALAKHRKGGTEAILREMRVTEERITEYDTQLRKRRDAGRRGRSVEALADAMEEQEDYLETLEAQLAERAYDHVVIPETEDEWPQDLGSRRRLIELVIAQVRLLPGTGGRFNPNKRLDIRRVVIPGVDD